MTDEELIRKSDVLDDLKAAVAEEVAIRAAMWVAMAALVWRVM